MHLKRGLVIFWPLLAGMLGCNLLNTSDSENVAGRGAKVFDPYKGPDSGAIRLHLQMLNGCTILPTGVPVGRGNSPISNYPGTCLGPTDVPPGTPPPPPMELLTGTTYFLNQITIMDTVLNQHTDPSDMGAVTRWIQTETRFKNLDWTGVGVIRDVWEPSSTAVNPGYFTHGVSFGNAKWQGVTDDTFKIEFLDTDGQVRQSATYARREFLVSNPVSGHTMFLWENDRTGAPLFPGDLVPRDPPPGTPGFPPPGTPNYKSIARMDLLSSTVPSRTFRLPVELQGDGAIRLTWSQLPNEPFEFPVRYVSRDALPPNCYDGQDPTKRVPCDFGLEPALTLSRPQNGSFYQPGEAFQATLAVKDGAGNYIHPKDSFPSWNEFITNRANGMIYALLYHLDILHERDTVACFNFAGPRQDMVMSYELGKLPYYLSPSDQFVAGPPGNITCDLIVPVAAIAGALPGGRDMHFSTTYNFTIPADAKSGTYDFNWKVHRHFMGERFTKLVTFPFQVGQAEKTSYPNRIGNCQICHRGVLSLDNLRHGIPVDNVEGCKVCHNRNAVLSGRWVSVNQVHALHMQSKSYSAARNDCTMCHLTRESTIRASYITCGYCHPQPHGTEYFPLVVTSDSVPGESATVYSNCGGQCHSATSPPITHIIPRE